LIPPGFFGAASGKRKNMVNRKLRKVSFYK